MWSLFIVNLITYTQDLMAAAVLVVAVHARGDPVEVHAARGDNVAL